MSLNSVKYGRGSPFIATPDCKIDRTNQEMKRDNAQDIGNGIRRARPLDDYSRDHDSGRDDQGPFQNLPRVLHGY